ncbi:MAG TPA: MFS transporter [Steroidobacteraceae bacterium]
MKRPEHRALARLGLFAGRYRWVICALLFAATAINYVDRQIIGLLKPTLQHDYNWTESDFADIVFWFQAAYAVGYLACGRLIDAIGARLGFAIVVIFWTSAHIAHALVGSLAGFIVARIALGLGESGNFPAGLKAVAEWFPQRERALANGIFTAGSNVGAIVTPLIVPFIALRWGWRFSFVITGALSVLWLIFWLRTYRAPQQHPKVTREELKLIQEGEADAARLATPSWRGLLLVRETWAYALARFLVDPIWWMFLFWLPDFFAKRYGLDLAHFGPPLIAVYLISDVGSVAGGWMSSRLLKRGWPLNAARKITLLAAALLVVPVLFALHAGDLWLAVGILGVATAGHQAFSVNLYTFPSDVFPKPAVATVVGIGGTAGAVGGMLMSKYAGFILDRVGSYTPIFVIAAFAYLLALLVFHLLSPRLARVEGL